METVVVVQRDDEILRIRERLHRQEASVSALELLSTDTRGRLTRIERTVKVLSDKDRLADAVADRMKERGTVAFTRWQLALGSLVAGCSLGGFVIAVVSAVHK